MSHKRAVRAAILMARTAGAVAGFFEGLFWRRVARAQRRRRHG